MKKNNFFDEEYHIGSSLKDAGKKCFGITKIEGVDDIKGILIVSNSRQLITR